MDGSWIAKLAKELRTYSNTQLKLIIIGIAVAGIFFGSNIVQLINSVQNFVHPPDTVVTPMDPRWFHVSDWDEEKKGPLLIWNPDPRPGETVRWTGLFKTHVDEKTGKRISYVHGEGTAYWSIYGKFEQSDEGSYLDGKPHGTIILRFRDGPTVTTEWDNGVKIK